MWWVAAAVAAEVVVAADHLEVPPVAFQTGKAQLVDDAASALDAVAATMAAHPELKVRVEVHTDSAGSDAFNLKLSQARADAIVAGLTSRGVAPERLVAQGWGELQPVADNATAEGRAANRRVEWWTDPNTSSPPAPPAPAIATASPPPAPSSPPPFPHERFCASLSAALETVVSEPDASISLESGQCRTTPSGTRCDYAPWSEATLRDAVDRCLPSGSPTVAVTVEGRAVTLRASAP